MEKFFNKIVAASRDYRSKKLEGISRFLLKLKLTPNILTTLSLLSGLLAVYFLFSHYIYFAVLAVLHLIFDGLDGVAARHSQPTMFGKYFDHGSDNLIAFLLLLRVGQYLDDIYPYLIAGLYALAIIIHFASGMKAPIIFIRTTAVIVLIIAAFPDFLYPRLLITIGYLAAGGTTVYSLARQLQWVMGARG